MAILKHRDVEAAMPPEVRRRARKAGVGKGKVDWYAGRRYNVVKSAADVPPSSSGDVADQLRKRRRALNSETTKERRKNLSAAVRAIVSLPARVSHVVGRDGVPAE